MKKFLPFVRWGPSPLVAFLAIALIIGLAGTASAQGSDCCGDCHAIAQPDLTDITYHINDGTTSLLAEWPVNPDDGIITEWPEDPNSDSPVLAEWPDKSPFITQHRPIGDATPSAITVLASGPYMKTLPAGAILTAEKNTCPQPVPVACASLRLRDGFASTLVALEVDHPADIVGSASA